MQDKKRGIGQPDFEATDIFAPAEDAGEGDTAASTKVTAPVKRKRRSSQKTESKDKETGTWKSRVKTTVEFPPDTLATLEKLKLHYRINKNERRPIYQILAAAIDLLAKKELK